MLKENKMLKNDRRDVCDLHGYRCTIPIVLIQVHAIYFIRFKSEEEKLFNKFLLFCDIHMMRHV